MPLQKVKRNADGTIDKRTKEGKAAMERIAKANATRMRNRLKRIYGW